MKTLRLLGAASVLGIAVTACSSSNALTGVTQSANQTQGATRDAYGPDGVLSHISTRRGWMSPESRKRKKLLYISDNGEIAIFSVPGSRKVGRITDGIGTPMGLATDKKGYLYVANGKRTVTIYKPGATSPWLTLHGHGRFDPVDVAVGSNGYVYVADSRRGPGNGIYVYAPGATGSMRHLANSALANGVLAVNVDASNNVYATGESSAGAAVVKFANARGSGTNLGLRGFTYPDGVIVDNHNNLLVSDFYKDAILIYPPGHTSPSGKLTVPNPTSIALNKPENLVYVPECFNPECNDYGGVGVYDYPSGTFVATISIGRGLTWGAALSPAPTP